MNEIKSLADQLRGQINNIDAPKTKTPNFKPEKKKPPDIPEILELIRSYDNRDHKSMMHIRFDGGTLRTLNHFKMATGVDVTKLVAFAVHQLFKQYPELKTIIKQYIQSLEI